MTKRKADMTPEELDRTRAQSRAQRAKNPERQNEATRRWRAANLDKARARDREKARQRRVTDPDGVKARAAGFREKHRGDLARRQREWNAANPEKVLDGNLRNIYGLPLEAYDALHAKQDGVCGICARPGSSRGRDRLNVDHCHDTGRVRGLLCGHCNRGLGHFRDDPGTLGRAMEYLGAHS